MMSGFVGLVAAFVLFLAGLLHVLWALRIWWPIREEQNLANAVVGAKDINSMPSPVASLTVAICLFLAAFVAILLSGWLWLPGMRAQWALFWLGTLLVAVFGARGAIGYTAIWRRVTPQEPFRTLDRRYFSPLCLLLAGAFAGLLV